MKKNQISIDTLNRTLPMVSPVNPVRKDGGSNSTLSRNKDENSYSSLSQRMGFSNGVNFPKILEENVGNFCPSCRKTIFSNLLEIDGKVYLEKNCCTKELVFIENDVEFFKKSKNYTEVESAVPNHKSYEEWLSGNPNWGTSGYALLVTNRCNQNCPVCYMKFNGCPKEGFEVSIEEIKKKLKKYHFRDIHLLGGEPTVRSDLFEIIEVIKKSGDFPGIYTNGLKLQDKNYLKKLKKAGLKYISLQFDGFNRTANIGLRGQDNLDIQLKVLENIKELKGLKVTLVPIIEKGINEAEISKIIQFALKNEFIDKISFIGLTPPPYSNMTRTTCSDLIKVIEKEGYFNQEYFLELMRMYCNIYKVTRKIIKGTLLEDWVSKRLSNAFRIVHFKKGTNSPQLLFQKKEIDKINRILVEAMSKKSRIASFGILLKNSKELIKSPLTTILREKFFIFKKKASPSSKLLEIGFHELAGCKNRLLKEAKVTALLILGNIPPLAITEEY